MLFNNSEVLDRNSHKTSSSLRDIVLGGQDGIVNTLGVLLGIAIASNDLRIIFAGGLAAAFAESVSMAAVAYTSTVAQHSLYEGELAKERTHIREIPEKEREEIREEFRQKGFSSDLLEKAVDTVTSKEEIWLKEMMKFEHGLEPFGRKKAVISSVVVGFAAITGSLLPLIPFILVPFLNISIFSAAWASVIISALALFVVGVYKAQTTIGDWKKSGLEMAAIGTLSALVGFFIGYLFKTPVGS
jgi:predicted membrane protein (TIGR00267 family)